MTIKGLTDRQLSFPQIGNIRKGAKKSAANRPGQDLKYFRVEFDASEKEAEATFSKIYGDRPTEIRILLPFNEVEENFDAFLEAYTAGRMVARSDGERILYLVDVNTGKQVVINGIPEMPHPQNNIVGYYESKGKKVPIILKPVGRLKIVLPELLRLAYLVVHTTSKHDIMNLSSQLRSIKTLNNGQLAGIPLVLRRRPVMISVPMEDGTAARMEKWLLSIEADPQWVKAKLLEMKQSALPGNGLNLLPEPQEETKKAESIIEYDEDDEDEVIEGEVDSEPEPEPEPKPTSKARPLSPDKLKESLRKAAERMDESDYDEKDMRFIAATLEYIFMSKDKRHIFIKWLSDEQTESIKELPKTMILALKKWLKPVYSEEKGAFIPSDPYATYEANEALKEYLVNAGQMELFSDPETGEMFSV